MNNTILKIFQGVVITVGGIIGFMYGEITGLFMTLISFMGIDYLTGIICAIINKKISSKIGFHGICKKVLILIIISMGHLIDTYIIKNGSTLKMSLIFFYISNEGISILENFAHMGLPIPTKIIDILLQLKNDNTYGKD